MIFIIDLTFFKDTRDRNMRISNKIARNEELVKETSAVGAGVMHFSPAKQDEEKLREVIRKSIKIYSKHKKKLSQESLQEQKLRNVVKSLISEMKQNSFPTPTSTLEGYLSEFFNNSGLYQSIRSKFYQLQTDREEKVGFIRTFLERSNEVMSMSNSSEEQANELNEEDKETEERKSREEEILSKWNAFTPSEVSKSIKLKQKEEKDSKKEQESEQVNNEPAATYEQRGSDAAREIFEQRVEDELKKIMLKFIGEEKEQGKISIMQNFAAWFDMWTDDAEQIDQFLGEELRKYNIPVPPQMDQQASVEEPVTTDGDISVDEPEVPEDSETEEPLEEDLFDLLEMDLQ